MSLSSLPWRPLYPFQFVYHESSLLWRLKQVQPAERLRKTTWTTRPATTTTRPQSMAPPTRPAGAPPAPRLPRRPEASQPKKKRHLGLLLPGPLFRAGVDLRSVAARAPSGVLSRSDARQSDPDGVLVQSRFIIIQPSVPFHFAFLALMSVSYHSSCYC